MKSIVGRGVVLVIVLTIRISWQHYLHAQTDMKFCMENCHLHEMPVFIAGCSYLLGKWPPEWSFSCNHGYQVSILMRK